MAALVFLNASVNINNTDVSAQVRSVTLNYSVELLDASAMGVGATRTRVAGLLDWTVSVEFNQDFTDNSIDEQMYTILTGKAAVTVKIKPVAGSTTPSNPEYNGSAFLESYTPYSGGVAEVAVVTANFQGSGALARATS